MDKPKRSNRRCEPRLRSYPAGAHPKPTYRLTPRLHCRLSEISHTILTTSPSIEYRVGINEIAIAMATETLELPCGDKLPVLGYGTGTVWMKSEGDDVDRATVEAIKEAIDLGYRHLDGAQYYETEPELGLAIKESKVPRAEFFVTTKAVSPIDVEGALVTSLKKLRMEYVDLYDSPAKIDTLVERGY
ncbi:hypothetical protein V2G26_010939 [Clonostachys chloroleuca]